MNSIWPVAVVGLWTNSLVINLIRPL
jgi:hypothetical protein